LSRRGLIPLLAHLRATGVVAEQVNEEPVGSRERLLKEFVGYLATERGLAPRTISGYERVARRFLVDCASDPSATDSGVGCCPS
jgi:hypothetical protein